MVSSPTAEKISLVKRAGSNREQHTGPVAAVAHFALVAWGSRTLHVSAARFYLDEQLRVRQLRDERALRHMLPISEPHFSLVQPDRLTRASGRLVFRKATGGPDRDKFGEIVECYHKPLLPS